MAGRYMYLFKKETMLKEGDGLERNVFSENAAVDGSLGIVIFFFSFLEGEGSIE